MKLILSSPSWSIVVGVNRGRRARHRRTALMIRTSFTALAATAAVATRSPPCLTRHRPSPPTRNPTSDPAASTSSAVRSPFARAGSRRIVASPSTRRVGASPPRTGRRARRPRSSARSVPEPQGLTSTPRRECSSSVVTRRPPRRCGTPEPSPASSTARPASCPRPSARRVSGRFGRRVLLHRPRHQRSSWPSYRAVSEVRGGATSTVWPSRHQRPDDDAGQRLRRPANSS